jgi:hypothetical protein
MYADAEPKPEGFGGELVDKVESELSIATLSEDKIYTEESIPDEEFNEVNHD